MVKPIVADPQVEPTVVPWSAHEDGEANTFTILDSKGNWLMSVRHNGEPSTAKILANAAFMVRACNTHDALTDQLLAALPFLEDLEQDTSYKDGVVKKRIAAMRAILKEAGAI